MKVCNQFRIHDPEILKKYPHYLDDLKMKSASEMGVAIGKHINHTSPETDFYDLTIDVFPHADWVSFKTQVQNLVELSTLSATAKEILKNLFFKLENANTNQTKP